MLTQGQIERQDQVDSAIYTMLMEVLSETPEWDIEIIAEIREIIIGHYDLNEMEFYPYVPTSTD